MVTIKAALESGVDDNGATLEIKTWRRIKAYTVYGKFNQDDCVCLSVDPDDLVKPNQNYTQAKYRTMRNNWYLSHVDPSCLKPVNHFHCWTNIQDYRTLKANPAASIMGLYQAKTEGPPKYWMGRRIAQGYYVTLLDDEGKQFVALVWKSLARNKAYRFALDCCGLNDRVLIVNAREQVQAYRDRVPGQYVVTTIYPPVINSGCTKPSSFRDSPLAIQHLSISDRPYNICALAVECH